MLVVETIAKIRRAFFVQKKSIKEICRDLRVSRKVVRKIVRLDATESHYERSTQPLPKIGPWRDRQILGQGERRWPSGRNPCLRRPDHHSPGRDRRRRASAMLWPRRDDLRSLALRAGSGPQAWCFEKWRAVQGLGLAFRHGENPSQDSFGQAASLKRRRVRNASTPCSQILDSAHSAPRERRCGAWSYWHRLTPSSPTPK
jgi:hypothetical protein